MAADPVLLSVRDAAARLGLSEVWVRRLISQGRIQSVSVAGRTRVPAAAVARHPGRIRPRQQSTGIDDEWAWEGNVVGALAAHLSAHGWTVVHRADPDTRERGTDLVVSKDGRSRAIEVKGYPRARHVEGRKAGQRKAWRPTMARNYMGDLVLHAMLLRTDLPDHEVAIAVPDVVTFTRLVDRIERSLERLGIGVYVIRSDGMVDERLACQAAGGGADA